MLEEVYDIKDLGTPTHGFFACDTHCGQVVCALRDIGIDYPRYVAHVDPDWFRKRDEHLQNGSRPISQALPSKLVFNNRFLGKLPSISIGPHLYTDEMQEILEANKQGKLKWYMTFHPQNGDIPEQRFVHCTMQGYRFSWHLQQPNDNICESDCHTIGLWRD